MAMDLYNGKHYAQAADAFERIIAKKCTPTFAYYAALSNQSAHRTARARQLFEYVSKSFPSSVEGGYSRQMLATMGGAAPSGTTSGSASGASPDELPESVRAMIPANLQGMLNTPEGRRAIADAMKQNSSEISAIKDAEKSGKINGRTTIAMSTGSGVTADRGTGTSDEHPFTAADVARLGSHGIDQSRYPNCWFECSMAALADLPRGQRLIASMIKKRKDAYVVRFPQDGQEYVITLQDLADAGISDKALWASLIQCAQTRKFPGQNGAAIEAGLSTICGAKAEVLEDLHNIDDGQLSHFIGGAVTSANPIVCGSMPDGYMPRPALAVTSHAYTIIGFDPSKNMVTIRNPWGRNPNFNTGNLTKSDFEMLNDGVFKMSLKLFKLYYSDVARAFI